MICIMSMCQGKRGCRRNAERREVYNAVRDILAVIGGIWMLLTVMGGILTTECAI